MKMKNFNTFITEADKTRLDPSCQDGWKKDGTKVLKKKDGTTIKVNNCVPEDVDQDESDLDEVLDIRQRKARAISLRKNKSKIAMGKRRASKKIASNDKLKMRARKAARNQLAKKFAQDTPKSELSPARKAEIEKRLDKLKPRIDMMAKRMFKDIRKKEIAKKRGGNK